MSKYTIRHSCGHNQSHDLRPDYFDRYGNDLAKSLCRDCDKQHRLAKGAALAAEIPGIFEPSEDEQHINQLTTDAGYRKSQALDRINDLIAELTYQRDQLAAGQVASAILPGPFGIADAAAQIGKACAATIKSIEQISALD